MLCVGLIQLTSTDERSANLGEVERLVALAGKQGAELVALPECFSYLGREAGVLKAAQPLDGPLMARLRGLAKEVGVWLLAGGFPESIGESNRIFNTAALMDDRGEIQGIYRKMHLFDVDLPSGLSLRESKTYQAGDEPVVVETPWGRFGLTICYDLRFPELYRRLTMDGARLIFVPSAFTEFTGKDHWRVLLRARAIENGVYMVAPAQIGAHGNRRRSYGRSLIADPWGQIIVEAQDRPGVTLGWVDFDYLEEVRTRMPSLQHRRLC